MSAPDLLRSGSDGGRRPPRRVLLAAGLVLALAVGGDRWQLSREQGALVRCVEGAESAAVYADRQIAATAQYAAPGLSGTAPAGVRASLQQVLQQTAAKGIVPAQAARRRCSAVRILPWHAGQRRGRDTYVSFLRARTGQLRRVSQNFDALSTPSFDLGRSQAAALTALRTAVPSRANRLQMLLSP